MQILSVLETPNAIPLTAFVGTDGMRDVLDHMNSTWRGAGPGVIFGEGQFGDRYRKFTELVTNKQRELVETVSRAVQAITAPDKFQLIDSQEALEHIPPCMYIPILTYAPVRKLWEEGMLHGWDVRPEDMPEEDVVGRLINNGRFDSSNEEWMKDKERGVSYTTATNDPDYTREQLNLIESSREFIDEWLEEQLGPGGDHLDMTDLPNQMGKLRPEE